LGLGDLTLLLVGGDSLAQQLHVHLEHRGADIERTAANEALDTIRVAVPDLILISQDASISDAERIRDGLIAAGKPPRMLAFCEKKLAAKVATYKHDFVATLEPDLGADLIASCVESLCALMGKPSSASRPLRSLVADVRRSQIPSKQISASKQTLVGTAPLVVPPPAAAIAPQAVAPQVIAPQVVAAAARAPISAPKPQPQIVAPKPIASVAPIHASQPTPIAALLQAPPAAPVVSVAPAPKPIAATARVSVPVPVPVPAFVPVPVLAPVPVTEDDELSFDVSVAASLPAPPSPVAVTSSLPTPTPLFVETQTATPAPEPFKRPSPIAIAQALIARSTPRQRMAAAAAALLCIALGAAASFSGDEAPLATHASANINQVAQPAKPQVKSAAPMLAAAPAPVAAPKPAPTEPVAAAPATHEAASDEPEDSMVDGELYNPSIDPARAKANYLVNMGHRLRKQNRLGMAEASYLKALNAMPNYARAVSGLVAVHLSRRDGVEALRWAKKLVQLQGKRGAHHRLLGDAYALAGNKSAARSAWQQGVRLGDRMSRSRMQ
jgi:hypothetical protein